DLAPIPEENNDDGDHEEHDGPQRQQDPNNANAQTGSLDFFLVGVVAVLPACRSREAFRGTLCGTEPVVLREGGKDQFTVNCRLILTKRSRGVRDKVVQPVVRGNSQNVVIAAELFLLGDFSNPFFWFSGGLKVRDKNQEQGGPMLRLQLAHLLFQLIFFTRGQHIGFIHHKRSRRNRDGFSSLCRRDEAE